MKHTACTHIGNNLVSIQVIWFVNYGVTLQAGSHCFIGAFLTVGSIKEGPKLFIADSVLQEMQIRNHECYSCISESRSMLCL